jgi:hypothetical protein
MTGDRLQNIMAIPIFANVSNSPLILEYAMTLKPKRQLIADDIDALRLPIATVKGRHGRSGARAPKMSDALLNKWAKIGLREDVGEMQMVGVVQVVNGVVNPDLGKEGGIRSFMEVDEEVRLRIYRGKGPW